MVRPLQLMEASSSSTTNNNKLNFSVTFRWHRTGPLFKFTYLSGGGDSINCLGLREPRHLLVSYERLVQLDRKPSELRSDVLNVCLGMDDSDAAV